MKNTGVVILAAGKSVRMKGLQKPFLQFTSNKTFLEHLTEIYLSCGCKPVIIITNQEMVEKVMPLIPQENHVRVVINKDPGYGRFHSIQLGAKELPAGYGAFIQNIDNPFIDMTLAELMVNSIRTFDFAVPAYKNRKGHPVLLSHKMVENIKSQRIETHFRLFLKQFNGIAVPVNDPLVLVNINTPEGYTDLFRQ